MAFKIQESRPSHGRARHAIERAFPGDPTFAAARRASAWHEGDDPGLENTKSRRLPLVQVIVRDNNVDQALKVLKKKMQREGVFREMKLRKAYEKPSERRAREKSEAIRRARKLERKRLEREGF